MGYYLLGSRYVGAPSRLDNSMTLAQLGQVFERLMRGGEALVDDMTDQIDIYRIAPDGRRRKVATYFAD